MSDSFETRSKELLQGAARSLPSPSPYLATRVLAELRDRKARHSKLRFWRRMAVGISGACALLLVFSVTQMGESQSFSAGIGKPYAVRVELENISMSGIALAEIRLPEGVRFYSPSYPDLMQKRVLMVEWSPSQSTEAVSFPFVIQAEEQGAKEVEVRFLSADGKTLVASKMVKIRFNRIHQEG